MKIDINTIDRENFIVKDVNFCGIDSVLVTPNHIGAKYTPETLHFRSSIWSKEGELLSAGYKKFFNFGEQPALYPNPDEFDDWHISEKKDGSLVIVDYVNGQLSMRTRGTDTYLTQDNAKDFEVLLEKYPKLIDHIKKNDWCSYLLEILTPNNVIVINNNEVDFYLLDIINKMQYDYYQPHTTDFVAAIANIKRPKIYSFKTLSEMASTIKEWKGAEGVVLSYNGNKNKVKLKSDWYNACHRIKSKLNTMDSILDLFISSGRPGYIDFYQAVEKTFDFEIAEQLKSNMAAIVVANEKVVEVEAGMIAFVKSISPEMSRKDKALTILAKYSKESGISGYAFQLLDGKKFEDKQYRALIAKELGLK